MKYNNPIIKGFHPDPSICRVGEDYYLVTSSFEYFPGLPIFHSRDLVNWKQIGNCLQKASDFPLMHVKDSGGIWAPTIRYEKGIFYVTATLEQYGNFIIQTTDPAGKWSAPVWVSSGGIDPSLFFEDGKAYYCTNHSMHPGVEEITLTQINPDSGRLLSATETIWNGTGAGYMEAPHVYHIGDWYYLMAAEGGTFFNHMITMARSRTIWGPYESCPDNPILTNVHDTSKQVQCAGHGDLFQDHYGNWWIVHLGTRVARRTMSHLGRETFLTPVIWENGWPRVENNRKAALEVDAPIWAEQVPETVWKADFTKKQWEPECVFLRKPVTASYKRGKGMLELRPSAVKLSEQKNPTFVAVRQPDFDCAEEMSFTFETEKEGDEAGIALLLSGEFYYCFGKRRMQTGDYLIVERNVEDISQVVCKIPVSAEKLTLRVEADREKYHFFYSENDGGFAQIASASTRFLSCEIAGKCFTGTMMGLYAVCREETGAVARVTDWSVG